MPDRQLNFGDPADAGTRYQIEDDANAAGGGNFVLAKDLDGGTVLLQYNPTSDAFEYVRSVDMSGEDVTGVGGVVGESGAGVYDDATQTVGDGTTSADHASVNTVDVTITKSITDPTGNTTNSKLIHDNPVPTPTCYFGGPAHGEGAGAFRGAALAPDGRIIFAPGNSSNVGIFDPSDGSYTSGPAHGEGAGAFIGAALAPDGRVILAPYDSSNVGIFDPSDNSYTSGPAHGEGGNAFRGAALAPDGRVILAPRDSSNVGIFGNFSQVEKPYKNCTHPLVQTS